MPVVSCTHMYKQMIFLKKITCIGSSLVRYNSNKNFVSPGCSLARNKEGVHTDISS